MFCNVINPAIAGLSITWNISLYSSRYRRHSGYTICHTFRSTVWLTVPLPSKQKTSGRLHYTHQSPAHVRVFESAVGATSSISMDSAESRRGKDRSYCSRSWTTTSRLHTTRSKRSSALNSMCNCGSPARVSDDVGNDPRSSKQATGLSDASRSFQE